jgi:hypothetical protein
LRPLAWRDETIRTLRTDHQQLVEQLAAATPSFLQHTLADRRIDAHMSDRNFPDRGNLVARKLKSYAFAQSHGVRVPTIYGLWDKPEDIDWPSLPDEVVIKSNTGASTRGVFPLRRMDGAWSIVTKSSPIASEDIVARLRSRHAERQIGGPFFAEELLGGGRDNRLPDEVRVAAFYGEIAHVVLRQVPDHGNTRTVKARRVSIDGAALDGDEQTDDLAVPGNLDEIVDVARRLSSCIPRPYVRVDLYDIAGEVVFGELTPRPGSPKLGADLDRRLGELWEEAEARVLNDVIDGGDYRMRFGPGPRELRVGDVGVFGPERGWADA